jgi:hypothetical protein
MDKLLIIANAITEDTGARGIQASKVLKELIKNFEVWIITNERNRGENYLRSLDGRVFYLKSILGLKKRIIRKLSALYFLFDPSYSLRAANLASKLIKDNSILKVLTLSMDYSNSLSGIFLKKRCPYISLFSFLSDPLSNNTYYNHGILNKSVLKCIENQIFGKSNYIIVPTKKFKQYLSLKYKDFADRIHYIPPIFEEYIDNNPGLDHFTITHFGVLNRYRSPIPLIEFAKRKSTELEELRVKFDFIGSISRSLQKKIDRIKGMPQSIRFINIVPYSQTRRYLYSSNCLLVIDTPLPDSLNFPSKIVEYFAYNLPIIGITSFNSEIENVFKETGHNIVYYEQLDNLLNIIRELTLNKFGKGSCITKKFLKSNVIPLWEEILSH